MPPTSFRTVSALLFSLLPMPAWPAAAPAEGRSPGIAELRRDAARFAPVSLRADLSALPASERRALGKLVAAARIMDALFFRQVWAGNPSLLAELAQDRTPLGAARIEAFLRNKGPWDRLEGDRTFVPGAPARPGAGSFYPPGAKKDEVQRWLDGLAPVEREVATGFFTVVRRRPDGQFVSVPYALEYQGELARAAELLREAAEETGDASLRTFLRARADAFLSNDYYASDLAWMRLDSAIEPTIGPYEVYEDRWFAAKAAFEAVLGVRDETETEKLARFSAELQGIEDVLPIDPTLRNPRLSAQAPIRVVNEIFAAGDAATGAVPAAFALPNDERIVREMGAKRVMLKNVQEAKFRAVLRPIAGIVLAPADRARVTFEAFFTYVLMHELAHGLGPQETRSRGVTVRAELEETYGALEEAKADVVGLFALQMLIDEGKVDRAMERELYPTFVASAFRSLRFGPDSAHAQGTALQLNWLLDAGAISLRRDGTYAVHPARVREAVVSLAREIMTIQANGDRDGARALLARMAVVRPQVRRTLDRFAQIPVDIAPRFVTAEALEPR